MKKILAMIIVATATVSGSVESRAACIIDLKLYWSYAPTTSTDNTVQYYGVQPSSTLLPSVSYYFFMSETDEGANMAAANALANGLTVRVRGNASACPTSGSYRNIGVADYLHSYTLR